MALFRKEPISLLSAAFLLLISLAALLAFLVAPYDPEDQQLRLRHLAPLSLGIATNRRVDPPVQEERFFLLGTDRLGRDVLSRLIYGGRLSLAVAALGVVASGALGVSLGLLSGYCRGVVDYAIKLTMDVFTSVPDLVLALVILYILGPGLTNIVIVFVVARWARYCRVTREVVTSLRVPSPSAAAGAISNRPQQSIGRRVLPALVTPLLAIATLEAPRYILMESTLSFVGFGLQPPDSSWGLSIAHGMQYVVAAKWVVVAPGVAILLTALAFNLVGARLQRGQQLLGED